MSESRPFTHYSIPKCEVCGERHRCGSADCVYFLDERVRDLEAQLATKLGAKDAQIDQLRLEIAHLHAQLAEARAEVGRLRSLVKQYELICIPGERDAEVERLSLKLAKIQTLVNEQAEDDGLWFVARTAPEGYLQQELRRLHAVVEE